MAVGTKLGGDSIRSNPMPESCFGCSGGRTGCALSRGGGASRGPGYKLRFNYQLNEANEVEQTTATRTTHSGKLVSNTSSWVVLSRIVDSSCRECGADRRVGRRQAKTGDRPSGDQQNRSGRTRNGDCKSLGLGGTGQSSLRSEAEAAPTGRP